MEVAMYSKALDEIRGQSDRSNERSDCKGGADRRREKVSSHRLDEPRQRKVSRARHVVNTTPTDVGLVLFR